EGTRREKKEQLGRRRRRRRRRRQRAGTHTPFASAHSFVRRSLSSASFSSIAVAARRQASPVVAPAVAPVRQNRITLQRSHSRLPYLPTRADYSRHHSRLAAFRSRHR
ncbi:hypothetical protein BC628DRAFT_1509762, partial [Trametes gibbosa]